MYPPDLGPGKHGCGDELVFVHFLLEHSPPALLEQLQLLAVPGNDEPVDTANKEALRPSCASGTRWERVAGPSPAPHFILSRCPARPGLRLSSFSLSCSLPQDPPGTTQDVRAMGSPLIAFTVWEHPRGTCLFPQWAVLRCSYRWEWPVTCSLSLHGPGPKVLVEGKPCPDCPWAQF